MRKRPRDERLDRYVQVVVNQNNQQAVQMVAPVLQLDNVNRHPAATSPRLSNEKLDAGSDDSEGEFDDVIPEETVFCKPTTCVFWDKCWLEAEERVEGGGDNNYLLRSGMIDQIKHC